MQRLARNNLLNIFASNSLVECVLTLMGGGRFGAPFRPLTRCDVIESIITLIGQIPKQVPDDKKNIPLLWERIEHLTQSVKSVLGEGSSRREQNNCPLTLARSRRERGILLSCNNFPLSIFNLPFIQRENRRVRFNAPQPTTTEVLC